MFREMSASLLVMVGLGMVVFEVFEDEQKNISTAILVMEYNVASILMASLL